jgi:hypothetical protein
MQLVKLLLASFLEFEKKTAVQRTFDDTTQKWKLVLKKTRKVETNNQQSVFQTGTSVHKAAKVQ